MARDRVLSPGDVLPLTCTRGGSCCHGHRVRVNPWEVARLACGASPGLSEDADAAQAAVRAFRAAYLSPCGTELRFDAAPDARNAARGGPACRLHAPGEGCTRHADRPLVCRLFPLARVRGPDGSRPALRGPAFPCLSGCPEVAQAPQLSVAAYLAGQDVDAPERAHDAYLALVEELAEGALVLLLDSGLAASGDRRTVATWRTLSTCSAAVRASRMPAGWSRWEEALLAPHLAFDPDPARHVASHAALLRADTQTSFGALARADDLHAAAVTMMGLAWLLADSLGASVPELAASWLQTARAHGARG